MLYWLGISILLVSLILVLSRYTKVRRQKTKLSALRNRWLQPNEQPEDYRLVSAYLNLSFANTKSITYTDDLNLNMLFEYVDRTTSKPGKQYLYKTLHQPAAAPIDAMTFEDQLRQLTEDEAKREQVQLQLLDLDEKEAYYLPELFSKVHTSAFNPAQTFYIKIAAILVVCLSVLLALTQSQVYFIALLGLIIANLGIHISSKQKISHYTDSLAQILKLHKVSSWLYEQSLASNDDSLADALSHVAKLRRSLSFLNLQSAIDKDPSDLSYAVTELLKILLLLEPLLFIVSLHLVNKYRSNIEVLYKHVGETDMLISVASFRKSLPYYCLPEFIEDNAVKLAGLYHPLVENCVANSIQMNTLQGILITGSNMSGKTTFIRAVAINALLGQTLHTCCARSYQAPLLDIYTSINMTDDIASHTSYFQAEALSVLNIINQATIKPSHRSLVIIDEIFRGTNTIERIAAAKAVLSYLTQTHQCFVIVSTHDLELAELLGDEYAIYSFEESVAEKRLIFDYQLKLGLLKHKNGIAILQGLGYPDSIIHDANEVNDWMKSKYRLS